MMLSKFPRTFVACLLLYLSAAFNLTGTFAQTLGGTVIANQASASYNVLGLDSSGSSNTVESNVPSFCTLAVAPNGSTSSPAQTVDAIPGGTVYLPYTLSYTGNITTTILLQPVIEATSTLLPNNIAIILDSNNNALADAGEPDITSLSNIAFNSSTALLLAVTLEPSYASAGVIDINLRANCEGETIFDEDNLGRVNVLRDGVTGLLKTSVPASNSQVQAGDTITYRVGFTVNGLILENTFISDQLADALSAPTALSLTVNNAARTGATYDAATRTVTATLGSLNPADVVSLTFATTVLADTAGAVTIDNQATLGFTGGTLTTNTVTHTTPATCAINIQPNGTVTEPAFTENALPGDTVVYPYTFTNSGNVTNDFALETTLVTNDFLPTLSIVLDSNNNQIIDAGELTVTRLDALPRNETAHLLLVVTVPGNQTISGDSFVNLIGRCAATPATLDDNNISKLTVPNGGITGLQKSAEPADGKILYPGADLHYFIDFAANGRDLSNVVISDILDERLTAPSSFTTGEIRDDASGLTTSVVGTFDAATRKLTWNFASVPAGMNVRLEFATSVKTDAQPQAGDTISNTANFSSSEVADIPSNTVTHLFDQLQILLTKVATKNKVFVGETLDYVMTIVNPDESINLRELVLTDILPDELRYVAGTARVKLPGLEEQAQEPTIEGQKLIWILSGIKPSEQIVVTISTEVLASALYVDKLVNSAGLTANDLRGRSVAAAAGASAAAAVVEVDKGVFNAPPVLLGTVFEDSNDNGVYDQASDRPVSGVRLYLSDGSSVVSDELGRYTFLELSAGTEIVKVDATSLPARLLAPTTTQAQPGLWRVRLERGLITRQDVPLLHPETTFSVSQALNIVMGPVEVQKSIVVTDAATTVILRVSSEAALYGLVIQDVLPEGVTVVSEGIAANGLTFNLGDVSAPYQTVIKYSVQAGSVDVSELLIAPVIAWEVQP